MSTWKRYFGLDAFDTLVHVVVSAAVSLVVAENTRDPTATLLVGSAFLVAFAIRRRMALNALGSAPSLQDSGKHRLGEVEVRLDEVEALHARVAELEERLDFSERLLAQRNDPARVEAPR